MQDAGVPAMQGLWLPRLMQLKSSATDVQHQEAPGKPGIARSCRFTPLLDDCRRVRRLAERHASRVFGLARTPQRRPRLILRGCRSSRSRARTHGAGAR